MLRATTFQSHLNEHGILSLFQRR